MGKKGAICEKSDAKYHCIRFSCFACHDHFCEKRDAKYHFIRFSCFAFHEHFCVFHDKCIAGLITKVYQKQPELTSSKKSMQPFDLWCIHVEARTFSENIPKWKDISSSWSPEQAGNRKCVWGTFSKLRVHPNNSIQKLQKKVSPIFFFEMSALQLNTLFGSLWPLMECFCKFLWHWQYSFSCVHSHWNEK